MIEKKTNSMAIKLKNRLSVYRYIQNKDSVSKQDIVIDLQLSLPTVTQNVQYLEEHGLIDTSKKFKHTGGRNATAYTYIRNAKMAMGVYITSHHFTVVAVDLSGDVVGMIRERVKFNLDDDEYLMRIGTGLRNLKDKLGIADDKLLGVGIAVPGLVSDDGEYVTYGKTNNFTGKTREQIAKYIPYPTRLFHDTYSAGYAEVWNNSSIQNAFYINLSNSVGGSVVVNHEIIPGDTHRGGEIGHMVVVPTGGKQCYCGQYGCFETVCNAGNLDRYSDGNLEEFFRILAEGDKKAAELWDTYLDNLALGIINIRMLFDSTVIVGGYVGTHIPDYIEELRQRVDARNPFGDSANDYLILSKYKVEAVATGAALWYIEGFVQNI